MVTGALQIETSVSFYIIGQNQVRGFVKGFDNGWLTSEIYSSILISTRTDISSSSFAEGVKESLKMYRKKHVFTVKNVFHVCEDK